MIRYRSYSDYLQEIREKHEAQEGRCSICKEPVYLHYGATHPLGPSIDHMVPLSKGGTDDDGNRYLCHKFCNRFKSDDTMEQLFRRLKGRTHLQKTVQTIALAEARKAELYALRRLGEEDPV